MSKEIELLLKRISNGYLVSSNYFETEIFYKTLVEAKAKCFEIVEEAIEEISIAEAN